MDIFRPHTGIRCCLRPGCWRIGLRTVQVGKPRFSILHPPSTILHIPSFIHHIPSSIISYGLAETPPPFTENFHKKQQHFFTRRLPLLNNLFSTPFAPVYPCLQADVTSAPLCQYTMFHHYYSRV